jgi:serine/threonine-protein kinase/endoribonuclease IRE1
VLGKGCEGTFVFKGTFENREVAVKRLLPDCFTLADREVALLRESDTHENVVRYFCTESDRQFRYIAVELCTATLQDYIEGKNSADLQKLIPAKEVLYQATSGLSHLHHLNIVHRDIKPQNVLISYPDNKNRVRALISDFGLCKKVTYGKASFSKKSGVTGTDGWIAPEMIRGHRTTISVDIFSLGCVYYYVLSNGSHPFGDNLQRQANILANKYTLDSLTVVKRKEYEGLLAVELIRDMVNEEGGKRPSTEAVLKHPLFWREEKILAFFQDVSDRIEKLDLTTEPLRTLERNAKAVIREDWSLHLHEDITADLRKYRGYHGMSVRCLLRALRNKKHHFHELSSDMQRILGSIPNDFIRYWINRFPMLLSHTFHAMESCSKEVIFKRYYTPFYKFTKPEYLFDEDYDNVALLSQQDNGKLPQTIKSPKKENKGNGNVKTRRGTYNFIRNQGNNGKPNDTTFITRADMQDTDGLKKKDDNVVWVLQKKN